MFLLLSVFCLRFRIIFLGLITGLSGLSYFFIIAVIVLLRRQFLKPQRETETQKPKVSKDIELKTSSNPTEGQSRAPKTPTLPHNPKVGRLIPTNNTQGMHQPQTLTQTTVELTCLPGGGAKAEMEELKPEEEVTDGNDQTSKDQCTCGRGEAGQSHRGQEWVREKNQHTAKKLMAHKNNAFKLWFYLCTGSNKSQNHI